MKLIDLKKVIELEDLLHEINENIEMIKNNRGLRISEINSACVGIPLDVEIRIQVLKKLKEEKEKVMRDLEGLGVEV